MIVLGVDPSITACGICVVDRTTRSVLMLDTVRSDTSETDEARYRRIYSRICGSIRKGRAVALAVEEQRRVQAGAHGRGEFNANNSKVSIVVGLAMAAAWAHGLPCFVVTPQRGKIAVLGKGHGNAKKDEVKRAVERMKRASEATFSTDAADAVGIACAPSMIEIMAALRTR